VALRLEVALAVLIGLQAMPGAVQAQPADAVEVCASTAEDAMDARAAGRHAYALQRFEACANDACPRVVREDCRAALAELGRSAPRLSFRVRDAAGQEVTPTEIHVGGRRLGATDRQRGVVLDAGTHRVVVRAGRAVAERSVVVGVSDAPRTVEIALPRAPEKPPDQAPASGAIDRTPAFVVGGVAVAALGAAAILGISSYSDYRDLEGCRPSCDANEVTSARTRGVVADVALGIGIGGLAAAVVLLVAGPRHAKPSSELTMRF
jgi:hypothetical protein